MTYRSPIDNFLNLPSNEQATPAEHFKELLERMTKVYDIVRRAQETRSEKRLDQSAGQAGAGMGCSWFPACSAGFRQWNGLC